MAKGFRIQEGGFSSFSYYQAKIQPLSIIKYNYEKLDEENEDHEDWKKKSDYNAEQHDNDSSFDFAPLELDLPDVPEVKDTWHYTKDPTVHSTLYCNAAIAPPRLHYARGV